MPDSLKMFKPSDLTANLNLALLEDVIIQVLKLQSGGESTELDAKLVLKQFLDSSRACASLNIIPCFATSFQERSILV
ncbi:hypothetical protein AM305_03613 [Actinobacillus minor NM305]|uniref:Uncharacterized protein n=1 Tax=Actinobacillus minor NM305 TaxID=637911 RepID=C5S531_9PAST|nr:hypothetical protein AM305_03613 [Actinobacillus minor NM305]